MRNKIRTLLASVLAICVTAGTVLPAYASSTIYEGEYGIAAETTEGDTPMPVKELTGACDGDGITLRTEDDFGEGTVLNVTKMRSLEDIQADMETGLVPEDRYSLEDVQSLLMDYLRPAEGQTVTVGEAYDIRLTDDVGYDLSETPKVTVKITLREEPVTDTEPETRIQAIAGETLYHLKDDGQWEELPFTVDTPNGEVEFSTTSFSPFVFAHITDAPKDAVSETTDVLERDTIVYPKFHRKKCIGCGRCEISCADGGHQAITLNSDRRPVMDPRKCVGCHLCVLVCPQKAISGGGKRIPRIL